MSFQWSHFLSLAARLLNFPSASESEERTAIGRAYYAAYCETRELATTRGLRFSRSRPSHEQVWQFMRSGGGQGSTYGQSLAKVIGDQGIALRVLRVQADYYKEHPPTRADAERAVAISQQVLKRLRELARL